MSRAWPTALLILAFALVHLGCSRAPERQHVAVSGSVEIAANAAHTIESPQPLVTPNYWNALCLQPRTPNALSKAGRFGILSANGEEFFPQVFMRSVSGTEDQFSLAGQMGDSLCFQPASHEQALHSPYIAARILSPSNLSINAVQWHSSDK